MRIALAFVFAITCASSAAAHITLASPPPRANNNQKVGPCGGVPAGVPAHFKAGETIMVTWDENVSHGGHFQIAFSADGEESFKNPASYTDIKAKPVEGALLDGLYDHEQMRPPRHNTKYEAQFTLPNVVTEHGVLRLIQVMMDSPVYNGTFGAGSSIYSQCADIALSR